MNHMIPLSRAYLQKMARGVGLRQIRLISGTVMFAYLISHFLNHALGNISMEALATGVHYHTMFWRFLPVAILFYGACLVHTALGVWALYQRREFRWKAIEPLQLVLGLSIPMLIVAHVVGIRLGQSLYGHEKLYPQTFYLLLHRLAVPHLGHARGARGGVGARLYRAVFLAADAAFLRTRFAVPARCSRTGPDAGDARHLPGRPYHDVRFPGCRLAAPGTVDPEGRHGGAGRHARPRHQRLYDRLYRPARPCPGRTRRAHSAGASRAA